MLVRLMYASRAAESVNQDDLVAILKKSQANNPARGITGVLCSSGRIFLQVLEGGRLDVSALFHKIANDKRNYDVMLLSYEEVAERWFASWTMGQVHLQRINPSMLLKYSDKASLDPYTMPAAASMALFKELVATASVMGLP